MSIQKAALLAATGLVALAAGQAAAGELIVGLREGGTSIMLFDSTAPGATLGSSAIGGLAQGERLIGIDYRPHDQQIYGIVGQYSALGGNTGARIVTIDPFSGTTTAVASVVLGAGTPAAPSLAGGVGARTGMAITLQGDRFGIDVNPVVDLIRVVSDAEQNIAINPGGRAAGGEAGATRVDALLNRANSANPNDPGPREINFAINATAYSNNRDGAASTTQYTIDSDADVLRIQNSPNSGSQRSDLALFLDADNDGVLDSGELLFNALADVGFDISGHTDIAYVSSGQGGTEGIYRLDLTTGALSLLGSANADLIDITVFSANVPEPAALGLFGMALVGLGFVRRRA